MKRECVLCGAVECEASERKADTGVAYCEKCKDRPINYTGLILPGVIFNRPEESDLS
jgi:hypothetical protein